CRCNINGKSSVYAGRQKDAFNVIPGISHAASDRVCATEDVPLVNVTTHGDYQIEVVDKGITGCWPRRISPCKGDTERLCVSRHCAGKGPLLTSRGKQLTGHFVVERMSNCKDVEEVI